MDLLLEIIKQIGYICFTILKNCVITCWKIGTLIIGSIVNNVQDIDKLRTKTLNFVSLIQQLKKDLEEAKKSRQLYSNRNVNRTKGNLI